MGGWFTRDFTGRSLDLVERGLVDALSRMLDEVRPAQVEAAETALTAERTEALICLVPHRWLGGLSLIVWLRKREVTIVWAQISRLSCDHDDLDLGYEVARREILPGDDPFAEVVLSVREQLTRPIHMKADRSAAWAEVGLLDARKRVRRLGRVGTPPGWFTRLLRRGVFEEFTLAFTDTQPPPVREPSNAGWWFEAA